MLTYLEEGEGWWSGNKVDVSSLYLGSGHINAGMFPEGTKG